MIEVDGVEVPTTDSGFLRDHRDWTPRIAEELARREGIVLSADHWEIVHFIRQYFELYQHLPNARMFVKAVQKTLGETKGNSRYLHRLFPGSAVKFACLIAGLPKPPGCI
ncbi:TusE/DsrC/DsvC family sulfur relay protein [Methylococcus sp. EFPC2]|uniref:TusE/DsrC/DsvC family sulfur relay protein n=1 Tax=Methylococcus sp. EFPC2 TaxID=2812648 RepID=UPI001967A4FB|nr:TusE/DsrC/DsvC family sulfur relay protein [Methylococcus sp. EFPC2]QSA98527.1 TusE/DsrC/DsvC family sulfur relay protein [Methylococcus sp. EFPC2]